MKLYGLVCALAILLGSMVGFSEESIVRPKIIGRKPHDVEAFTQGLLIDGNFWLESTGLYGKSQLREVDRESGKVNRKLDLPDNYFGEGLALLHGKLYQLTWKEGICRVVDRETFEIVKELTYEGEGWGLTTDGSMLYMSDGTAIIRVMDPNTFKEVRRFRVVAGSGAINRLNELEWVNGELWANRFQTGYVVRIDPRNGKVFGVVDLRHLPVIMDRRPNQDVLNGIALDPETGEIWVTGKFWNALYRLEWPPQ